MHTNNYTNFIMHHNHRPIILMQYFHLKYCINASNCSMLCNLWPFIPQFFPFWSVTTFWSFVSLPHPVWHERLASLLTLALTLLGAHSWALFFFFENWKWNQLISRQEIGFHHFWSMSKWLKKFAFAAALTTRHNHPRPLYAHWSDRHFQTAFSLKGNAS